MINEQQIDYFSFYSSDLMTDIMKGCKENHFAADLIIGDTSKREKNVNKKLENRIKQEKPLRSLSNCK